MKRLFLTAVVGLTLVSCKKEDVEPNCLSLKANMKQVYMMSTWMVQLSSIDTLGVTDCSDTTDWQYVSGTTFPTRIGRKALK